MRFPDTKYHDQISQDAGLVCGIQKSLFSFYTP